MHVYIVIHIANLDTGKEVVHPPSLDSGPQYVAATLEIQPQSHHCSSWHSRNGFLLLLLLFIPWSCCVPLQMFFISLATPLVPTTATIRWRMICKVSKCNVLWGGEACVSVLL